jgi:hypothetical protein
MGDSIEGAQGIPVGEIIYLLKNQRHDFVNHLQVIRGYLQLGKADLAVNYIIEISKELAESGRIMQLPWPELAAILMLKGKQVQDTQTKVKLSLGQNLEKVCQNPSEALAGVIGDIYELVCNQLGSCSIDGKQVSVQVNEEQGAYVINFSWPQDPANSFDKLGLLSHPVMENAQNKLRKVELSDQEETILLSLYLPLCREE